MTYKIKQKQVIYLAAVPYGLGAPRAVRAIFHFDWLLQQESKGLLSPRAPDQGKWNCGSIEQSSCRIVLCCVDCVADWYCAEFIAEFIVSCAVRN